LAVGGANSLAETWTVATTSFQMIWHWHSVATAMATTSVSPKTPLATHGSTWMPPHVSSISSYKPSNWR